MKTINTAMLACALAACAAPALALQTKNVRDGVAVEAVVSMSEPTRIRAEGAKIVDVVGRIYSSTCAPKSSDPVKTESPAVNPLGEFVLTCDLAKGEIYISPVPNALPVKGKQNKPINIFVSTDKATYTLLLRPADVPADTIVLVDKSAKISAAADRPRAGKSATHVRSLKEMLLVMAGARSADDISAESVNQERQLWNEARFVQTHQYTGRGLVGESYELTNVSALPMVLAEQEFDREGSGVLAVAIERMNLLPGERTAVYVIRAGE